jgi:hypothetical protein
MAVDITRIVGFRLELAFIPVGTGILAADVAGRQGFEPDTVVQRRPKKRR